MSYKPLPDCLTIKESEIEGLGLFAKEDISKDYVLGMSHFTKKGDSMHRKPLGGFYNHSDTPNCKKIETVVTDVTFYYLVTLRDIKAGEEITCKYTFYKIE